MKQTASLTSNIELAQELLNDQEELLASAAGYMARNKTVHWVREYKAQLKVVQEYRMKLVVLKAGQSGIEAMPEVSIRKAYGIPKCIHSHPSDAGNDDASVSDWAYVVQHEIDLYEEDQDSPDIKTRVQYNAAKKSLAKLQAAA